MKLLKGFIFFMMLICCLGLITGCVSNESSAKSRIKDLTNINVPNNSRLVFHYYEGDNQFIPVPGRRSQYSVFEFQETPIDFLTENKFISKISEDFERKFDSRFNNFSRVNIVPHEYIVNWNNEYSYLEITGSAIFFIYVMDSNILIIFISGT